MNNDDDARTPDDVIPPWAKGDFKFPFKFSPKWIILIVVGIIFLSSIFYTIGTNEVGMVLRFGRYVRKAEPGLHMKLPLGIENVIPVKIDYVYKDEFGFRTRTAGERTTYQSGRFHDESLMLTGDLNVIDLQWVVQYKIKDPMNYLFNIKTPGQALRDISESVTRRIIGNYAFDEVLTTKRIEINNEVQDLLQEVLDSYQSGLGIVTVKLQDVNPPDSVKPAFNEVNQAKQEREKLINQAWEAYNKKIPQARGEAGQLIEQAEGFAAERINEAEGDAQRFNLLRKEYIKSREVTKKRLYLENMEEVLKKAGKKYVVDPKEKNILPLLRLNDEKK
jgi:modulator of FtsH protease HflK